VSMGFSTKDAKIPWGPALLAPIAERVRREADIPVAAAWGIDAAKDVERVISAGELDLVMIGHAHLADLHYTYRLAMQLGVEKPSWATLPAPYAHWLANYRGAASASAK
jgi:2,4-dienoyl-CoA reductase-like NADH-dependent reductase (Old Yellow Enzyme family)